MTYDGSTVNFYVNGALISSASCSAGLSTDNNANVFIGASPHNIPEDFSGLMDEVRLYNRALSDSEVQELYNGFKLSFPLHGYTPYNAPISSVFDHSMSYQYSKGDGRVVAYTGEIGDYKHKADCYSSRDGSAFIFDDNYVGARKFGGVFYLCYDEHPGFDYAVCGTAVYPAAEGTVGFPRTFPGVKNAKTFNTVQVDHGNGFKTYYLHMTGTQDLIDGQRVTRNDQLGVASDTGSKGQCHLHFEVQKDGIPVDPYGWEGIDPDPYTRAVNINLWE